jgi:hypothetical protein
MFLYSDHGGAVCPSGMDRSYYQAMKMSTRHLAELNDYICVTNQIGAEVFGEEYIC